MKPRQAFCRQCDRDIDVSNNSGNYQQVVGFVKLRSRGANEVALRRARPIFICRQCMDMMKSGMNPIQTGLFDTGEG